MTNKRNRDAERAVVILCVMAAAMLWLTRSCQPHVLRNDIDALRRRVDALERRP